jgi:hypothetical protein
MGSWEIDHTLWVLKKRHGELSYKKRLMQLNLIPLVYDREQKDFVFFYKCMHGLIELHIPQYVEVTTGRTCAGTSSLLRTQACKTNTFQSSYFVRIVKLWNYVCKTAPSNCFSTLFSFKWYNSVNQSILITQFSVSELQVQVA